MSVDAMTRKFLDSLRPAPPPAANAASIAEVRRADVAMQTSVTVEAPAVDVADVSVPGGPRGSVGVRIVRPKGVEGALPAIVFFHGGGWVLCGPETHDRLIRELAHGANAAVVFVDYTRAPEATYPCAIEEGFVALKWVGAKGKQVGLDSKRIALAGDSAGGNLATVLALETARRKGPKVSCQALFYPVTDATFDRESHREFGEGYFLTTEWMKWAWDRYVPSVRMRGEVTASPLNADREVLKLMPPTLVITAENDILRDEGELYAEKVREAGVPVTATRYPGTIHAFMVMNALAQSPATRRAVEEACDFLRGHLAS